MPARTVRITVVPDQNGQRIQVLDLPTWWDRGAFFEKFKARELDLGNPIDWNLAWLLSAAEAIVWDEKCRKEYESQALASDVSVAEEMRRLASALRLASWVVVESREWESGL